MLGLRVCAKRGTRICRFATSRVPQGRHRARLRVDDAGETFTDFSGDLVDTPANWVEVQSGKLVVGTDVGVFISSGLTGGTYSCLGDLPAVPVVHLTRDPSNASRIVISTFGRGLYAYTFE